MRESLFLTEQAWSHGGLRTRELGQEGIIVLYKDLWMNWLKRCPFQPSWLYYFIHHHGQFSKTSISTFGGHEFCLNFLLMTREYTTPIARYDKSQLG